jgi:hypothetical protein
MFFKPTPTCLILTAVFLVVAYGGYVQSEAFTQKDAGQPPLPMAHFFEPIPHLWELWVLLLAPLALILRHVGIQQLFNTGPAWLFWTVQALYFYLISWIIVFVWGKLTHRQT